MNNSNKNTVTGVTMIATPTGLKKITSIHSGDEVLTDRGIVRVDNKTANIGLSTSLVDSKGVNHLTVGVDTEVSGKIYNFKTKSVTLQKERFLKYSKQEVNIHPYFLGLWLADGTSKRTMITSHNDDVEIHKFLEYYANTLGQELKRTVCSANGSYFTLTGERNKNELLNTLKEENLFNNKHIPLNYINNDAETRMQVLAGVLDGDSYVTDYSFILEQKSKVIIEGVKKIADSLGFKTSMRPIRKTCYNSPTKAEGTYWLLSISGDNIHNIPTKLPRKQFAYSETRRNSTNLTVKYSEPTIDLLYRLHLEDPKAKYITASGLAI